MNHYKLRRDSMAEASRGQSAHRKVLESTVFVQRPLQGRPGEYGRERLPTRAARITPESTFRGIGLRHRPRQQPTGP